MAFNVFRVVVLATFSILFFYYFGSKEPIPRSPSDTHPRCAKKELSDEDMKKVRKERQKLPQNPDMTSRIDIPVIWNVLWNGTHGMISEKIIKKQIDLVNRFIGPGANMYLQYPKINYILDPEKFKVVSYEGFSYEQHDTAYIWSTGSSFKGDASLPIYPSYGSAAILNKENFIILNYGTLIDSPDPIPDYDLGYMLIHELGHWLNLLHTFDGGCSKVSDKLDDTPAMREPTRGCPPDNTKDTCPQREGYDPIHNFMDFSIDPCYTDFTPGQYRLMRASYVAYRMKR